MDVNNLVQLGFQIEALSHTVDLQQGNYWGREGRERVSIKHLQAKMNADYYRLETE